MVRSIRTGARTLILVAALASAASVSAFTTTFATFLPASVSAANVRYNQTGTNDGNLFTISTPAATAPGTVATRFSFVNSALAGLGVVNASFSFFSTVSDNTALSTGGFLVQNIDSGNFSFTYTGAAPLVVGTSTYTTGALLLSGTFTNANIFGTVNGSAGSLFGSTPTGVVTYASDFMTFAPTTPKDFSLGLTSINPLLNRVNADSSVASFRANATGAFSDTIALVPEPQTWGMLLVGLAMTGTRMRRRSKMVSLSA